MSDVGVEPIARVRIIRRFSHYRVGEDIVMPLGAARALVAQRYAEPLAPPPGFAIGDPATRTPPQRQPTPGQTVKK